MLNLRGGRRLPMIRQNENSECGLAVLAMVAAYFGREIDLATMRLRFGIGQQGMTLKALVEIAGKLDLAARPVTVSLDHIHQLALPAILHWDMNHFVVLKGIYRSRFTILDPAAGERVISTDELSRHFTGVAVELTPTAEFEAKDERVRLRLSDLWGRMHGLQRSLLNVFLLSTIMQLFVLASPFLLQLTVDEVLTQYDYDLLMVLAFGFGSLVLINFVAEAARGYALLYFGSTLSYQMATNLFRHLLRLPIDYFEKRHIGDISSRFCSMDPVKTMLTEGLIASVIDGMMAVFTLTLMMVYSPTLAAIAFGAWLFYLGVRLAFYRPLRAAEEDQIVVKASEHTVFVETVRGVTSLKLFGGEGDRERLWSRRYADVINAKARHQKLTLWFNSANSGIFGLENVLLIYVAARMVMANDFTIGMIFAFVAYKRSFTDKASALVEKLIEYRMLRLHLDRISDIAHTEKEDLGAGALSDIEPPPLSGDLELRDIRFRYSDVTPEVLKGVSLKVEPGEMVAIVGASGCGKTTMLKVMCGLFDAADGEVLVDGQLIKQYGLSSYRRQTGVVMQNDELFTGSIAENIAFFDPLMDLERIVKAAQDACIHDEIQRLPMKYETFVGDMGSGLSGGQRQRVMLARALYRRPKLLFMDEGTAHLDVATERRVNETVSQLGITRIVIAHRPETIRMADRILEFVDGRLIEQSVDRDRRVIADGARTLSPVPGLGYGSGS